MTGLPRLVSPTEKVSLEEPALRARHLSRLQAWSVALVAMLSALLAALSVALPPHERLGAYVALVLTVVGGGTTVGVFDLLVSRSLADLVRGGSALRQAAAERASELARANAALERRDRQRAELFATMSHELRTPLHAILGYSRALLDGLGGELTPEQREDVRQIHDGGQGLLAVVNGTLDLARLEAGSITASVAPLSAAVLIEEVAALVRPLATAKGLTLTTTVEPGVPRPLADEDRLRQVLLNLVGNAIKFTDQGTVTISATRADPYVQIAVVDTGPGIAEDAQVAIFEPFRQAEAGIARRHGGAGLGLAISQRLIELMDGWIGVSSTPGHGASFTVNLPAAEADPETAAPGLTVPDDDGGALLLIGEGSAVADLGAALTSRALAAPSADGETWRRQLRLVEPDLVVVDLMRPRAGAWQTLADLRADRTRRRYPVALVALAEGRSAAVSTGPLDLVLERDLATDLPPRLAASLEAHHRGALRPDHQLVVCGPDEAWRQQIRGVLHRSRLSVVEAETPEAALAALDDPRVVGLVVHLLATPDGIVPLLARVRSAPGGATVPVTLVGPVSLSPAQQRALYLGTVGWLREHGDTVDALAATLHEHLQRPIRHPAPVGGTAWPAS